MGGRLHMGDFLNNTILFCNILGALGQYLDIIPKDIIMILEDS